MTSICHEATIGRGAYPSPLNYHGFPKSICTSVNEVICHGIPDSRPLAEGDIVNLDVTVYVEGVHGDTSATYRGRSDQTRNQNDWSGSPTNASNSASRPSPPEGRSATSDEPSSVTPRRGISVIRSFCGHGIGEVFHSRPQIPHYYDPGASTVMEPDMTFTIEPMIAMGTWRHISWDDGWTAVTADGLRTAQFEHTVMVTPGGAEVLTRSV